MIVTSPLTSRVVAGLVVPIPTLPVEVMRIFSPTVPDPLFVEKASAPPTDDVLFV